MCVKVDLGIKLEILPVVFRQGNYDADDEPFRLWRPEHSRWESAYARLHQAWLSYKNRDEATGGNYIPAIKVFKHMRSLIGPEAVSFHIECLLFNVVDVVFPGPPADFIAGLPRHIAGISADTWYGWGLRTPCGERIIFTSDEWDWPSWEAFHERVHVCSPATLE